MAFSSGPGRLGFISPLYGGAPVATETGTALSTVETVGSAPVSPTYTPPAYTPTYVPPTSTPPPTTTTPVSSSGSGSSSSSGASSSSPAGGGGAGAPGMSVQYSLQPPTTAQVAAVSSPSTGPSFSGIGGFALVAVPMLFLWWVLGLKPEEERAR